jgi:hypothetical protein
VPEPQGTEDSPLVCLSSIQLPLGTTLVFTVEQTQGPYYQCRQKLELSKWQASHLALLWARGGEVTIR